MARSHQKYFTSDGHRMAIGQHSHTSDAQRIEMEFRQDRKCHVNKEKYLTQHNKNKIKSA